MKSKIKLIPLVLLHLMLLFSCKNVLEELLDKAKESENLTFIPAPEENSTVDDQLSLVEGDPVPLPALAVPSKVYVTNSGTVDDLSIEWSPVADSEKYGRALYRVYRSIDGITFTKVNDLSTNNSYDDKKTEPGQLYYYAVKTFYASGDDEYVSSNYSLMTPGYTLGHVEGLSATYLEWENRIDLSWNEVKGARIYEVSRFVQGSQDDPVKFRTVDPYLHDLVINSGGSVTPGVVYIYRVSAINASDDTRITLADVIGCARQPGTPDRVITSTINISKGIFDNSILIQWAEVSGAAGYKVYYSSSPETSSFRTFETVTDPLFLLTLSETKARELGDGNMFFRVSGINEYGFEGPLSEFNPGIHSGYLLAAPRYAAAAAYSSVASVNVSWSKVINADGYLLERTGPHETEKSVNDLAVADWVYLADADASTWITIGGSELLADYAQLKGSSYTDPVQASATAIYYYRVKAVNSEAVASAQYQALAAASVLPVSAGISYAATGKTQGLPAPSQLKGWLTATDNDPSIAGNIDVTIEVPPAYTAMIPALNFKLTRTYRYGGDSNGAAHQGYYAQGTDTSSHWKLDHPDPAGADTTWEKTITLTNPGYEEFSDGVYIYRDNLHDTNGRGEPLYAARNLDVKLLGDNNSYKGSPWYERSMSQIESGNFEMVRDPDGELAGYEWHYLKWDWVMRKYLYHSGNPLSGEAQQNRFDINEATRCDYKLELSWKNAGAGVVDKVETEPAYGWAALTPREFSYLGFILREIACYDVGLTFHDAVYEMGIPSTNDVIGYGWADGQMKLHSMKSSLSPLGGHGKIGTVGPRGVAHFTNCYVKIEPHWAMEVYVSSHRNINGNILVDCGERYQGEIIMKNINILVGTYYHWVHGGQVQVSTGNYRNHSLSFEMCNEYMNSKWKWARVEEYRGGRDWDGRNTSINWKCNGKTYPGY